MKNDILNTRFDSRQARRARYYILILLLSLLFFIALSEANAANALDVVISEIAWMGTLASDDDEWIELYNNTQNEIDLAGWTLNAQDGTPKINLTGKIGAQSFYILERTDDTTIADIAAEQIYTGALNNSGEYFILKDGLGNIIDQIDAWHAGSASNRATMERINVSSSGNIKENWATAQNNSTYKDVKGNYIIGSPKVLTAQSQNNSNQNSTQNQNNGQQDQNQPPPAVSQSAAPAVSLGLRLQIKNKQGNFIDADEVSLFTGDSLIIKTLANVSLNETNISWNDGRGKITNGGFEFGTAFQFSGTYIITVSANKDGLSGSTQLKVNVFTTGILISEFLPNPAGADKDNEWIELYNQNNYAVNLAAYTLEINDKKFVFADPTFIYPKSFLVIPFNKTSVSLTNKSGKISLVAPNGEIIDAVSYSDSPKENYAGTRDLQNTNKFYWTSKPTPGFTNLINPTLNVSEFSSGVAANVSQKNKNVIILNDAQKLELVENTGTSRSEKIFIGASDADENKIIGTAVNYNASDGEGAVKDINLAANVGNIVDKINLKAKNDLFTPFNLIIFEIIIVAIFSSIGAIVYFKRKI